MDFFTLADQIKNQVISPFSDGLFLIIKSLGSLFLIIFNFLTNLFK